MEKGSDEDNVQEREEERLARIRTRNSEDFERFGRFRFSNINEEMGGPASQRQTKRKKSTAEKPIVEVTRVLRSQSTRDVEEMPCDKIQEDEDHELDQETKGKKGKKRTRMHKVYDRLGTVPPIRVEYNEDGQPVGDNASEFSNFISTLVKSKISLRHTDWRKVEVEQKIQLWTTLQMYYVVDDKLKDWVMGSAAKKWRDFKSELKTLYFDDKTDEELQVVPDNRVSPTDWEELVAFWKSEAGKQRSQQGKQNRKEMELLHTSGSKSHARVSHEMHKKNGYPPHRHEVFMETHKCKKTGAPLNVAAANMFKKIENMENERPELLEKTIQQGDLFSHVTTKERNGYVRCKGLGPSAADLGMPGSRKLKSTKLQMAEEEAKEARQANVILHERVDKIENDFQSIVTTLKDEFLQMKRMLLQSNARQNVEFSPRYDSSQNRVDEDEYGHEGTYGQEDSVGSATPNLEVRREKEATILQKKTEGALLQKKAAAFTQEYNVQSPPTQYEVLQERGAAISQKKAIVQQDKDVTLLRNKMTTSLRKEVPVTQKNHQQGRDVILYNVYRDHSSPVAKATILSVDRREEVGGQELGSQYCKVVVNYVIKRDAILPRGVGNMTTMGQAQGRCIAWPYKHLEVDKSMANAAMRPQAS